VPAHPARLFLPFVCNKGKDILSLKVKNRYAFPLGQAEAKPLIFFLMRINTNRAEQINHNNFLILLLDLSVSLIASTLAILFVRWQVHAVVDFQFYFLIWLGASIVASLIGFFFLGTHKVVIRHSTVKSVGKLSYATLVKEIVLSVFLVFDFGEIKSVGTPGILLFVDMAMTLFLLIFVRMIILRILSSYRSSFEANVDRLSVVVFGISDKAVAMVTRLDHSKKYNVQGFLTRDRVRAGQIVADHNVYWFETEEDIEKLKVNLGFESVLFASENDAESEQDGLVKMCLRKGLHILTTPRIESVTYGGMAPKAIKQIVDNEFIPDGMNTFERNVKRICDMFLAAILLVVFSPLFLICFIALKIGDGGPAIYSQERVGRFGRPFLIYKFRSMRLDAESDGPALYAGDDDPRLTKVGKFLRQHHLDELPQLWNVFKGEMSFIGPRPERKFYIDQIIEQDPRYAYLYQIRPGVTSYATLKNGYTDSMEKMLRRLEFDLFYLRHRSWLFDIQILWQTFRNIAFGKKF